MAAITLPENANEKLLVEYLARQPRVNASAGKKRLEFLLEDGRLIEAHVHDRITPGELARSLLEEIPPESLPD